MADPTTTAAAKAAPKNVGARALRDIPGLKAKCGEYCEVPEADAKAMEKQGDIDLAPAAVAHARKHHMPKAEDGADGVLSV